MSLRFSRTSILKWLSENYFPLMIIGYILALVTSRFSVVLLSSIVLFVIYVCVLKGKAKLDFATMLFVYTILSIVLYFVNGRSFILFFYGLCYTILPMVMYFVPIEYSQEIIRKGIKAIFFSLIIAVVLYIWEPSFYADYLYNRSLIGRNSVLWIRPSLIQGLYGITTVANFSACCSLYYYINMIEEKSKANIIKFVLCLLILLYSMRRSAVAGFIIGFIIINFHYWRKRKNSTKMAVSLLIVLVIGFTIMVGFWDHAILLINKVMSFNIAVSERSGNWKENLSTLGNFLLIGKGSGSYGHLAGSMGLLGVFDSQYILMIMENGLIGFMLFICAIAQSIILYLKSNRTGIFTFVVVVVFLIQCIGSNVLEMPMPAALFWLSLSCMKNDKGDCLTSVYASLSNHKDLNR